MTAALDLEAVTSWFTRLYGAMPEENLINIVRTDRWSGEFVPVKDEMGILQTVIDYDEVEPVGIYHRITTVLTPPPPGPKGEKRRGDASQSRMLPGFWADVDIAGPGHKSKGALPPDQKSAIRIIRNSALPEPSLWVSSGGGLYPWWLLDEPFKITEENLAWISQLSNDLQEELKRSAMEIGFSYEPMGDLARVLRVPGTINRKTEVPEMCAIVKDYGTTFSIEDLRDYVPEVSTKRLPSMTRNADTAAVYEDLPDGPTCHALKRKLKTVGDALRNAEVGGRHAAALSAIGSLVWLGNLGHTGSRDALDELYEIFQEIKPEADEVEWRAMVDYVLERTEVCEDRHCCGGMTFTDAHLSSRMVREELEGGFLWSTGTQWMRWTGKIWEPASDAAVVNIARLWLMSNYMVAVERLKVDMSKDAEELVKHWKGTLSTARINGVVALARGQLEFDPSLMDADPDILNTPSGVVHLPTGELMEHSPTRLISKITGVDYDPEAEHEIFDQVLTAVPEEPRRWLQLKLGQAATGYPQIGNDPNVIAKGGGENGKTTFFQVMTEALGTYAVKVPKEVLTGEKSQHEIMQLWGARMALTEELPEGARLNTTALKSITDTPELQGRYLFKNLITWKPTHTLFVTTNPLPQVAETTHAVWRRLALVMFPYRFVAEERRLNSYERPADPRLRVMIDNKNKKVLKAALRWIVEGSIAFYAADRHVPGPPDSVIASTREWRKATDVILNYWDDGRIEADPDSFVLSEDLYLDFADWSAAQGNGKMSAKVFGPAFAEHQETQANHVRRSRPSTLPATGLSRSPDTVTPVPTRPTIWEGIRFAVSKAHDNPFEDHPEFSGSGMI